MAKKRYKGFKNKRKYRAGKKKLKNQLRIALKDKKLSRRELKKIRTKAKKSGYQGSAKRLAKLIKRSSKKIKPKAFKRGRIEGVSAKKNTRRLKQIKRRVAATKTKTPFYGPLKDPTKPPPNSTQPPFPPPGPNDLVPPSLIQDPKTQDPKKPPIIISPPPTEPPPPPKPETPTPPPPPPKPVTPPPPKLVELEPPKLTVPTKQPEIDWAALLKASQDTNTLLTQQLSQTRQDRRTGQSTPAPAPTINVQMPEMPEPEEALGRAKATSTYLSGGSAGGIRRRRSNRSKLGLSGLGTNQLNRNVSNLLSIRGISI